MSEGEMDALARAVRPGEYADCGRASARELLIKPVPDAAREHALDPRAKRQLEERTSRPSSGFSLRASRQPVMWGAACLQQNVGVREYLVDVDGDHRIDVVVVSPVCARERGPLLVHLHGGGFFSGDFTRYEPQMRTIAERSRCTVVFPEVRLAPECQYPDIVRDAWACVRWAHEHAVEFGADPLRLMVSADSAGASLANACVLLDDGRRIAGLFEIYPSLDWRRVEDQDDYTWSYDRYEVVDDERDLMRFALDRVKGCREPGTIGTPVNLAFRTFPVEDPLASIVCADDRVLAKFPSLTIVSAEFDFLRVVGEYAAARFASLGVPVRQIRYEGCRHGFFDRYADIPQARELCWTLSDELAAL